MKPWFLILGAGIDQLPAFAEARRRGFRIITADARCSAPGAALADVALPISTRDIDELLAALAPYTLVGAIAPASDAAMPALFTVSRHFGLPFPPHHSAVMASIDKSFFLDALRRDAWDVHQFVQSKDLDKLAAAARAFGTPLVVKPTDGSGGKGITFVHDVGSLELEAALEAAAAHSFSGEVIVEELIDGEHGSAEAFFVGGKLEFLASSEKRLGGDSGAITVGHRMGGPWTAALEERLTEKTARIGELLAITDGPLNVDFVLKPDGELRFIEVGARLAGNGMATITRAAYGVDLIEAAFDVALGSAPKFVPTAPKLTQLIVLGAPAAGVVVKAEGFANAACQEGILSIEWGATPGQRVETLSQSAHKLGYALMTAVSAPALAALEDRVLSCLSMTIAPLVPVVEAGAANFEGANHVS